MENITILTSTVVSCATYAKEVLNNDLSGLAGGGCGGSGGGCGCGGSSSLLTETDLADLLNQDDQYHAVVIDHDIDPDRYYAALTAALTTLQRNTSVNDHTIEYIKSTYNPIVIADHRIIAMGRIPDDFEIMEAIDHHSFVPVNPTAGF